MKNLYKKEPPHTFGTSMIGVISILFLGINIIFRGYANKQDFRSITGPILNVPGAIIDKSDSEENVKDTRYFLVDGYSKVFAIHIGEGFNSFTPKFEQLDSLKQGDTITVYFDEKKESNYYFNRLVQFIDKDQEPYFIRGRQDTYWGYSAVATSAAISILLLFYKKQGKIT